MYDYSQDLTDDQKNKIVNSMFLGAIPQVTQQWKNDPRTVAANNLITQGSSTAPLYGGTGAQVAGGLGRIAAGLLGGRLARQQWGQYGLADNTIANQVTGALGNQAPPPPAAAINPNLANPIPSSGNLAAATPQAPVGMGQGLGGVAGALGAQLPIQQPPTAPTGGAPPNPPLGPTGGALVDNTPVAQAAPGAPVLPGARAQGFRSYQSPAWDSVEQQAADEYHIPVSMLQAVRLAGERTNTGVISPAGANTVYQITPGTRNGIQNNYGFDPYSSPLNSARGAAAVLSENMKATGGNQAETFARYHAGTGGTRGPINAAYVNRTTGYTGAGQTVGQPGPAINTTAATLAPVRTFTAPQQAVPDLPPPPTPVENQPLPDRVQSARMEVAQRLLANTPLTGGARLIAMQQAEADPGIADEQKAREDEYTANVQMARMREESARNLYNTEASALYQAPIAERAAIQANNQANQSTAFQGDIQSSLKQQEAQDTITGKILENQEKGGGGKPVTGQMLKDLRTMSDQSEAIDRLRQGFRDDYAGYGVDAYGNSVLATKGALPGFMQSQGDLDQVQWWRDYNDLDNAAIHGLYGARLNDTELKRWRRYAVGPGDSAATIRTAIDERQKILQNHFGTVGKAASDVYNPKEVYDLMGGDDYVNRAQAFNQYYTKKYTPTPGVGTPGITSPSSTSAAANRVITLGNGMQVIKDPATGKITVVGGATRQNLQPGQTRNDLRAGFGG
jgi:hypothetical protein